MGWGDPGRACPDSSWCLCVTLLPLSSRTSTSKMGVLCFIWWKRSENVSAASSLSRTLPLKGLRLPKHWPKTQFSFRVEQESPLGVHLQLIPASMPRPHRGALLFSMEFICQNVNNSLPLNYQWTPNFNHPIVVRVAFSVNFCLPSLICPLFLPNFNVFALYIYI